MFFIPADQRAHAERVVATYGSGSHPLQTRYVDDPKWISYARCCPDGRSLHTISNRRVVHELKRRGDTLATTRTIDHRAYLPSEAAAHQAAAALQLRGFLTKTPTSAGRSRACWALDFTRRDCCEFPQPDLWTAEILDIVEPLGGEYDGWECMVVTAPSP